MKSGPKVAIIGAGLTGLSCAFHLEKANISPEVYEKGDRVGGRIRSDKYKGYILDRGFQVVMTSYPEFRKAFDFKKLSLSSFDSGALIRKNDARWIPLYHPIRHPIKWSLSFLKRPTQLVDFSKLLYHYSKYRSEGVRWKFATVTTEEFLSTSGITNKTIDKFFRPFFGGVFLEKELNTLATMFMRRFHHFLWGKACLPAEGMEAIPKQLASRLKKTTLHLNSDVVGVGEKTIELKDGKQIDTNVTVCALDSPSAQKLFPNIPCHASCSTKCIYFSVSNREITPSRLIMLGDNTGPINTLSLNSCVQPRYAPEGYHLLCASIVDDFWCNKDNLEDDVKEEIASWLKINKSLLTHIKTFDIPCALPMQDHPPPLADYHHPRIADVYLAGELVDTASINGALESGRKIAERVIRDLDL